MLALVELIDSYEPGFAETVAPATDADIRIFEKYVGPIAGAYRRFLKTMGGSSGEFLENRLNIRDATGSHRIMRWLRHERYLEIGDLADDAGYGLWLDRKAPFGEDDNLLVRIVREPTFASEPQIQISVSLEEYLYTEAFSRYRIGRLPHVAAFEQRKKVPLPEQLDQILAKAEGLGFRRIPRVVHSALLDRDDSAIALTRDPVEPRFVARVASASSVETERIAAAVGFASG